MGLTVKDMTAFLETIAPLSYQESYDNCGLLVGHEDQKVTKVMLAVDATKEVILQAERYGCEMLIVHHPLIFHPLKKVTEEDPVGERVLMLAEKKIALYAAHTNMDSAPGGNIDYACQVMGLANVRAVAKEGEVPCLRVGEFLKEKTLKELALLVKETFSLSAVRYLGPEDGLVKTVGLVTGSGMDFAALAKETGCDVLITGDITYHKAEDALREGLWLIDATHFGTDQLSKKHLSRMLARFAAGKNEALELFFAEEKDLYMTV